MEDPNRNFTMKVLMITVRADVGGGPEHVFQLVKALSNNLDIYIASPTDQPYWSKFNTLVGKKNMVEIPHRKISIHALHQMHRYIIDNDISVVHSHGKGAGIYSRILKVFNPKITIIHTLHGYHDGQYSKVGKKVYAIIENLLGRLTDKIINVSKGEKIKFSSATKVAAEKCLVIPNGVEVGDSLKEKISENSSLKVCYLARDDEQKNINEMQNIFKEFLRRYGEGSIEIDVYGILKVDTYSTFDKGINYLGPMADVRQLFEKYSVLLNTSKWEGMPISVLEAMAEGTLVIATDVVGNNDVIVKNESGYLYPLGSISAACDFLKKVAFDEVEIELIRHNAFNLIRENYSIEKMSEKVLSVYEELK